MWGEFFVDHIWYFLSMGLLLVASGFFSGSETALFNLSAAQVAQIANLKGSGRICVRLLNKPEKLLNTLLLSNLLVNVSYTAVTAKIVLDISLTSLPKWVVPLVSLAGLLVLILIGEVTPKMLALSVSKGWALFASPLVLILQRILNPLIWVLHNWAVSPLTRLIAPGKPKPRNISSQELSALIDLISSSGKIDRDATTMIKEIVDLTDLKTADIMVPRVDMICFEVNSPREKLGELFHKTGLRKIPVYDGQLDNIIGIVHAKNYLLNPEIDLRKIATRVTFVPQTANVERLLVHLRTNKTQLTIVVDEFGGTAGLVTLEDVLEEIIGEIPDPRKEKRENEVEKLSANEFLIDGNLPIHQWVDAFGIELKTKRISTIGGFVTSQLGRIANLDDEVVYRNLKFKVVSLRGRRIGRLHVQLIGGEA